MCFSSNSHVNFVTYNENFSFSNEPHDEILSILIVDLRTRLCVFLKKGVLFRWGSCGENKNMGVEICIQIWRLQLRCVAVSVDNIIVLFKSQVIKQNEKIFYSCSQEKPLQITYSSVFLFWCVKYAKINNKWIQDIDLRLHGFSASFSFFLDNFEIKLLQMINPLII